MCHSVKCLEFCNILLIPKCPALSLFLNTQVKDILAKHHSPESSYVSPQIHTGIVLNFNVFQTLCLSDL
jgi:hypothetical protein